LHVLQPQRAGAFGEIFAAVDLTTQEHTAIKVAGPNVFLQFML
jgi:hypothetical protein